MNALLALIEKGLADELPSGRQLHAAAAELTTVITTLDALRELTVKWRARDELAVRYTHDCADELAEILDKAGASRTANGA